MNIRLLTLGVALAGVAAAAQGSDTSRLGTVSVRAGFEVPRTLESHPAKYPEVALHQRAEGKVVVVAAIAADGQVGDVRIESSSGHASLDRAAVSMIESQRYAPARLDEQPVAVHARIPVTFALQARAIDTRIAAVDLL